MAAMATNGGNHNDHVQESILVSQHYQHNNKHGKYELSVFLKLKAVH